MTEFRAKTINGLSWSAISQFASQGFTFALTVILARILGPKVYGLVGMLAVFTGFAAIFGDLGLGAAIIQRRDLDAHHLNAAFWANAVVGALMTAIMMGMAPFVARFYDEPLLAPLTAVIAVRFVIDSLSVVQAGLLNRNMEFRKLALIQIGSSVTAGVTALAIALAGGGAWSLVLQTVGGAAFSMVLMWALGGWRPAWSFQWSACKSLFGFSGFLLSFNLVNYWSRTLDQLLIGRFWGAAPLGIYSRAYSLMLMPLQQISSVAGKVMLPALSSIQDDKARVRHAYLKAISAISLITFPMMVGLFVVADHFVLGVLGEKWAEVIPLLRIFCWVGLVQSVETTLGCICISQGKTGLHFALGIFVALVFAASFTIGIKWGPLGVAWSYFVGYAIVWYPCWAVPGRLIDLPVAVMTRTLRPTFLCALAMGAIIWGMDQLITAHLSHWRCLAMEVPMGIAVYISLVVKARLTVWKEGQRMFREMLAGGRFALLKPLLIRAGFLKESILAE